MVFLLAVAVLVVAAAHGAHARVQGDPVEVGEQVPVRISTTGRGRVAIGFMMCNADHCSKVEVFGVDTNRSAIFERNAVHTNPNRYYGTIIKQNPLSNIEANKKFPASTVFLVTRASKKLFTVQLLHDRTGASASSAAIDDTMDRLYVKDHFLQEFSPDSATIEFLDAQPEHRGWRRECEHGGVQDTRPRPPRHTPTPTPAPAAQPPECGKAPTGGQAFVFNGMDANALGSPWHAILYIKTSEGYELIGGGSLIHESFVLTAAQALDAYGQRTNAENFTVSFGSPFRDWSRDSPNVQRRNVSRTIGHPSYRGPARYYVCDIAVLELDQPVTFTKNVYPICVDRGEVPLTSGSIGTAVSWGNHDGFPYPVLQSAEMPFLPIDRCLDLVEDTFLRFLTFDKFCAGQIGGAALVRGDGGGGLAFPVNGRWWLSGIVSVGQRNRPSGFTRVAAHKGWLDALLKM